MENDTRCQLVKLVKSFGNWANHGIESYIHQGLVGVFEGALPLCSSLPTGSSITQGRKRKEKKGPSRGKKYGYGDNPIKIVETCKCGLTSTGSKLQNK